MAELMTALREETDKVAHTETTIANIQGSLQDRTKRKAHVEGMIKQMNVRLERAQMLSYSLEEECKKWRDQLANAEGKIGILVGETILLAMTLVYGCSMGETERVALRNKWSQTCKEAQVKTSQGAPILDEFFTERSLNSWLCKFPCYNQNYLSLLSSNKWSILSDPNGLVLELLTTQSPNLQTIDLNDEKSVDVLKNAVLKGNEVLVKNFELNYRQELKVGLITSYSHRHSILSPMYVRWENRSPSLDPSPPSDTVSSIDTVTVATFSYIPHITRRCLLKMYLY